MDAGDLVELYKGSDIQTEQRGLFNELYKKFLRKVECECCEDARLHERNFCHYCGRRLKV